MPDIMNSISTLAAHLVWLVTLEWTKCIAFTHQSVVFLNVIRFQVVVVAKTRNETALRDPLGHAIVCLSHEIRTETVNDRTKRQAIPKWCCHVCDVYIFVSVAMFLAPSLQGTHACQSHDIRDSEKEVCWPRIYCALPCRSKLDCDSHDYICTKYSFNKVLLWLLRLIFDARFGKARCLHVLDCIVFEC